MSSGIKKTIAFLFFLLAGVLLGTIIGRVCDGVPFLSWLAYTMSVGLDTASPLVLDLIVFKLAFGFTLSVNAAQIICVIISLIVYNKTCKGLWYCHYALKRKISFSLLWHKKQNLKNRNFLSANCCRQLFQVI